MSTIEVLSEGPAQGDAARDLSLPHVLLVVDQFPKTLGGGERIVLRLASLLPRYGYRASILTFFAHPESAGLVSPPCPLYLLPLKKTYDGTALRGVVALRRFLEEQQIRVMQTFFESSDLWAGGMARAFSDVKVVWSRRDMGILRAGKHRAAYRLLAGMPDRVFAVSEQVRRHCIEVDGVEPGRVQTVYNGLDLAHWSDDEPRPARQDGGYVITTVGNVRHVKGHDVLIRAAAMVLAEFPEASFTVAGDVLEPEYFAGLERLIGELGLSGRFQFVGGVSDLRRHLAGADFFVLPSRSEGFSNAIVEAMAAGLPVVATTVGGNAEAVQDGVTGALVPSEDVPALAGALLQLLRDPARARQMGAAGRERVAQRFTTDAMMGQVAGAYDELLGRRR